MEVTNEVVKRVADNARLNLTEEETTEFTKDFNEILEVFKALDEIETGDEELALQPVKLEGILREDEPIDSISQEHALENSDSNEDGFFKGPKV